MEEFYNSLQSGDLIYVRVVAIGGQNCLGLCRILKIKRYESQPDYIEFVCKVIQQWFPDYGPVLWFGKRVTVGCNIGIAYPGMWHVYTLEEFEMTHEAVRERRIKREGVQLRRKKTKLKIVKGIIVLAVILLVLYFLLYSR
jgi:hypothetical protein